MKQISVLLVEDHTVVRECFRMMLELESDVDVVGEARDGREAVNMALELAPNIILMDIAMPKLKGLEATRQLVKVLPASRIIILSANCNDASVRGAVDAGAAGFLLKQESAHHVCEAIRRVSSGGIHYSPSIAKRFVRMNPQSRGKSGKLERQSATLSSREMEVLQLVTEGYANKKTASELSISIKTVEKHRAQLMRKLGIHEVAGLTRYAINAGIIDCDGRSPVHG